MAETLGPRQSDSRTSGYQDLRSDATCPPCSGSSVLRVPGSPLPVQGSSCFACAGKLQGVVPGRKPGSDRCASLQCQVTVLTEPSPPPQPPPTSGSEQIGILKTINCSCPAGEKVPSTVHPQPPARGPRAEWGRVAAEPAVEVGISHHARELPGQGGPRLQATLRSGACPCSLGFSLLDFCAHREGSCSDPAVTNLFLKFMTSSQGALAPPGLLFTRVCA